MCKNARTRRPRHVVTRWNTGTEISHDMLTRDHRNGGTRGGGGNSSPSSTGVFDKRGNGRVAVLISGELSVCHCLPVAGECVGAGLSTFCRQRASSVGGVGTRYPVHPESSTNGGTLCISSRCGSSSPSMHDDRNAVSMQEPAWGWGLDPTHRPSLLGRCRHNCSLCFNSNSGSSQAVAQTTPDHRNRGTRRGCCLASGYGLNEPPELWVRLRDKLGGGGQHCVNAQSADIARFGTVPKCAQLFEWRSIPPSP